MLWKIVKKTYGLSDNLQIANTINALVRYNWKYTLLKREKLPPESIL